MNDSKLDYVAYKALLETDLTSDQKQKLIEISILDRLKGVVKGMGNAGKGARQAFNLGRYESNVEDATKNIKKELESIMSNAEAATGSKDAVYAILAAILQEKGLSPDKVASPPAPGGEGESGESGGSGAGLSPGQPVTMSAAQSNDEMLRQILQAVAELKGMSPDKAAQAADKAADKQPSPEKVAGEMASAVAALSGVSVDKVKKVYSWLEKGGHIEVDQPVKQESIRRSANVLTSSKKSWRLS